MRSFFDQCYEGEARFSDGLLCELAQPYDDALAMPLAMPHAQLLSDAAEYAELLVEAALAALRPAWPRGVARPVAWRGARYGLRAYAWARPPTRGRAWPCSAAAARWPRSR